MSETFMRVTPPAEARSVVVVDAAVAPFTISENFYNSRVNLGSFGIFQFDSMLVRIDPTGALRRQITDALNADPAIATAIQQAAFSPAGKA